MASDAEVVRGMFEAFNRGDVPGCLAVMAPDASLDLANSLGTYSGVYRGADEIGALIESYLDPWEELRWDPERFVETGDGRIVVPYAAHGRGQGSGATVSARVAYVFEVHDG